MARRRSTKTIKPEEMDQDRDSDDKRKEKGCFSL